MNNRRENAGGYGRYMWKNAAPDKDTTFEGYSGVLAAIMKELHVKNRGMISLVKKRKVVLRIEHDQGRLPRLVVLYKKRKKAILYYKNRSWHLVAAMLEQVMVSVLHLDSREDVKGKKNDASANKGMVIQAGV